MSMTDEVTPPETTDEPAKFSTSERNEIITRLQAVENTGRAIAQAIAGLENTLEEVHSFCARLATVLDALGGNPMIAAMMPPDVAAQMMDTDE